MPNYYVPPKLLVTIMVSHLLHETSSFIINIHDPLAELLISEAKLRGQNLAIQYVSAAMTKSTLDGFVNPTAPVNLFLKGVESLATAENAQDASLRGLVALGTIIVGGAATGDKDAATVFGALFVALNERVFFPGSQGVILCVPVFFKGVLVLKILIRIVTEIRVEKRRRELNLPLPKFKFNFFSRKKWKDYIFKAPRLKKYTLKILSRKRIIPVIYNKKFTIKQPKMVEHISVK